MENYLALTSLKLPVWEGKMLQPVAYAKNSQLGGKPQCWQHWFGPAARSHSDSLSPSSPPWFSDNEILYQVWSRYWVVAISQVAFLFATKQSLVIWYGCFEVIYLSASGIIVSRQKRELMYCKVWEKTILIQIYTLWWTYLASPWKEILHKCLVLEKKMLRQIYDKPNIAWASPCIIDTHLR